MTRREYRKYKLNNFNKWFLIRFAQIFGYFTACVVIALLWIYILIGASNQHYEKVQLIKTEQYAGER
jgi:hypothetical protein